MRGSTCCSAFDPLPAELCLRTWGPIRGEHRGHVTRAPPITAHLQLVADLLHAQLNVAESGLWQGVALGLHSRELVWLQQAVQGVLGRDGDGISGQVSLALGSLPGPQLVLA